MRLTPRQWAILGALSRNIRPVIHAGDRQALESAGMIRANEVTREGLAALSAKEAGAPEDRALKILAKVRQEIMGCTACVLSEGRTNVVPGEGHPRARIVFVGEAPGAEEDRTGRPFVGRSGDLLTRMIQRMGLERDQVFILNVCKCRPPGNRAPEITEVEACRPFLERQLRAIEPEAIVALGGSAYKVLHPTGGGGLGITKARGSWFHVGTHSPKGTHPRTFPVLPTYHPAYLLRNPQARWEAWDDLRKVLRRLDLRVPKF